MQPVGHRLASVLSYSARPKAVACFYFLSPKFRCALHYHVWSPSPISNHQTGHPAAAVIKYFHGMPVARLLAYTTPPVAAMPIK